ncbi:MAG: hypothetical protein HYV27_14695 [Candidatus Hydrogenedentes bacterium]|nr:hypothetical protein [Candidatus Hydrogenedentota bacterium]
MRARKRSMLLAIAGYALFCGAQAAPEAPRVSVPYALIRNDQSGAVVDAQGILRQLFWPAFGMNNQLSPVETGQTLETTQWGLLHAGGIAWQSQLIPAAPSEPAAGPGVARMRYGATVNHGAVDQEIFIHPGKSLVAVHLVFPGPLLPEKILWYQNLDPGKLPALGTAWLEQTLAPWRRDFAAFTGPGALRGYQFRPGVLNAGAWKLARELARPGHGRVDWQTFGEGVWCGTASAQTVTAQCGGDAAALIAGETTPEATVGDGRLLLTLAPDSMTAPAHCTIYLAFGPNRESVDTLLDEALEAGDDAVRVSGIRSWRELLAAGPQRAVEDPARWEAYTLLRAHTSDGGALCFVLPDGPAAPPELQARGAVMAAAAYQALGEADLARRMMKSALQRAALALARQDNRAGLPAAWRLDESAAGPSFLHCPGSAAWLISGAAYFESAYGIAPDPESQITLNQLGDYLAYWCGSPAGRPYPGYQRELGFDAIDENEYLLRYMGLYCARRLSQKTRGVVPELWGQRSDALHLWIQQRLRRAEPLTQLDPVLLFWMRRIIPPIERLWSLQAGEGEETRDLASHAAGVLEETPDLNPVERAAMVLLEGLASP